MPLLPSEKDKGPTTRGAGGASAAAKGSSIASPARRKGTGTGKDSHELVPLAQVNAAAAAAAAPPSDDSSLASAGPGSPPNSLSLSGSAVLVSDTDEDLSDDEIITGEGEEGLIGSHYLEAPDEAEIEEVRTHARRAVHSVSDP
jgi:hypothetical protein